jgi:hypothetical protein|tara:strand:- start:113 stop:322 length:210 start_codon:yes stop_codon:yes gene_type:complete
MEKNHKIKLVLKSFAYLLYSKKYNPGAKNTNIWYNKNTMKNWFPIKDISFKYVEKISVKFVKIKYSEFC